MLRRITIINIISLLILFKFPTIYPTFLNKFMKIKLLLLNVSNYVPGHWGTDRFIESGIMRSVWPVTLSLINLKKSNHRVVK